VRPKTPATKFAAFLGHLAEGHTIAAASRYACVARSTAYERRNTDKEFAAAWAEAEDTGIEVLEVEARRRAVDGITVPRTVAGERVDVTEYSDQLLIFLLKAKRPGVYRERFKHELSGPDGGPVPTQATVDTAGVLRGLAELGLVARRAEEGAEIVLLFLIAESGGTKTYRTKLVKRAAKLCSLLDSGALRPHVERVCLVTAAPQAGSLRFTT